MFAVSDEVAAAIQKALAEYGEAAAMAELRRHFTIVDDADARNVVRLMANWPRCMTEKLAR